MDYGQTNQNSTHHYEHKVNFKLKDEIKLNSVSIIEIVALEWNPKIIHFSRLSSSTLLLSSTTTSSSSSIWVVSEDVTLEAGNYGN